MSEIQLLERTITGLHQSLIPHLPEISYDTSILDIGCGSGAWLERLGKSGFKDLHGIDLDTKQFKSTKANCSQANLDDGDLGLKEKRFGLITAIEIIEHLENLGNFFNHVTKHLDENGYLLLTTPNIHSLDCRLRFLITGRLKSFDMKGDPTHISPVLLASLERILSRYSLEIVKQWGYPAKGSLVSRRFTTIAANILELALPNSTAGDTLCLLIEKEKAR
ncbi:MAG: class I SAM-dependent methyltransferase [Phormidesmis sp.]